MKDTKFKPIPLFGISNIKKEEEEPVLVSRTISPEISTVKVEAESNRGGWISQYIPNDITDRFILISPKGERFACKFYNTITNDFIGASLLAMYNLKEHYDRDIIPKEVV